MATTINSITAIPPAGKRGIQVRDAFVAAQEQFQDALSGIFVNEINATISQTNSAVSEAASSKDTAVAKAAAATQSASDAADSISTTKGYRDAAEVSANNADTSESNALDSKNAAASSASAANTSKGHAATSESNAANSASAAHTSESNAANSASAAHTSESNAADSKNAAHTSETNAANSASAAHTSETNADTSESNALDSKNAAASSASAANTSKGHAATSESNAANSASAAHTSETNAANSASAAHTSESNAADSKNAAATSANNAATSAHNADTSEANALASKNAAHTSANNADTSESNALKTLNAFKDIYLGTFDDSHIPDKNHSGNALGDGDLYFNVTHGYMKVYKGSSWEDAYANMDGAAMTTNNLSDLDSVSTARTNLGLKIGTNVPYASGSSSRDFNAKHLVTSSITTSILTETSARKYKENIEPLTGCLGVIEQLEPVTYNRKGSQLKEIGLIADDVLKVRPEYVSMLNGEVEGLFYQRIVADLIGAVKELQSEVTKLKEEK